MIDIHVTCKQVKRNGKRTNDTVILVFSLNKLLIGKEQ